MKYSLNIPNFGFHNPQEIAKLAQEAEDSGWDGFFIWDHMALTGDFSADFLDPWVALSVIAMKTEKIKIGTMVTPIPRRRPWKLAREVTSLDHLSKGRLILGVGLGTPEYDFTTFGENFNEKIRAKKLDEGLEILQGLLSGELFSYEGDYFQIEEVRFSPTPFNDHIPIWVAGTWPNKKPFYRAAKYDGVFPISMDWPTQLSPNELRQINEIIQQNRTKSGQFDVVIAGNTPGNLEKGEQIVNPYKEAGATWWCENINFLRFSNSSKLLLERIRQGPPKS
ncbi:MAG: LLM class flavin-dependent oxidoreductase [Promethearchaeota archaeon]|jgi:alkanesulfonate monooxygenase SsuD/methylene tetrahydromethanopterin reductase-like flavin-dependent oxidoreductase (luciferase family)